ncbi:hypothetical protein LTR17_002289 [Elasticomyces elasticus]|nr:hypothetical protein LTR17_002289 [Elasticomyces elasticus]
MAVTMMFTLGDLDEIVQTPTGYPFIQVFYNTTNSHVGTTLMTVVIILPLVGSVIACVATASRQIWSFARDQGVPWSGVIGYVPPTWSIPINAIMVSLGICTVLALINIGSATALNAILALGTGSILASYLICISCVTLKRLRGEMLPPRQCVTPTSAATMNFSSLLIGSVVVFATAYYVAIGRSVYTSPKQRVQRT